MRLPTSLVAATALFASAVLADVDPIIIKGSKFFYKTNGTQFFMRGIAYQQEFRGGGEGSTGTNNNYIDPLADVESCKRDVPLMAQLRTNTIRVYAIDPTKDHSACMRLLQDAGIYVVADLSQPGLSINRDNPQWDLPLYQRYTGVIDELQKYNNVIGYFAGNEVTNQPNNTQSTAFVKAAVRDMKAYIRQRNYRPMGVGYATNDDAAIRQSLADFFACGPSSDSIDFWGYNIYSWCGDSSFKESGYDERTKEFANYPVPVFFAEYGCNEVKPRAFGDVPTLYGDDMTGVWSGGIIYMYFEEPNNYGLVKADGNTVSKLDDFTALSSQMASATPTGVRANDYNPTNTSPPRCPPTGDSWNASSTLPPTPNQDVCGCVARNLTCVAKAGLSDETIAEMFGTVCGLDRNACAGVAKNGATGKYGSMSMCNSTDQLSWVFNAYYFNQSPQNRARACDFGGNARLQQPQAPSGSCQSLVSAVGPAGTGTVTAAPQNTGGSGGSGGGASGTNRPSGAAGAMTVPRFDTGLLQLSVYVAVAFMTGMGMILL
ncbi:MAG: hypothetical protein M1823_006180 [Watsoniomyces obsoletus]|nr:MAG: hypothetical protein M1823_006180 [Watsoniomyces obsoletus]